MVPRIRAGAIPRGCRRLLAHGGIVFFFWFFFRDGVLVRWGVRFLGLLARSSRLLACLATRTLQVNIISL